MPLRFEQWLGIDHGVLKHYGPYFAVLVVLLVFSGCSFPSPETDTPTPSPFQEFEEQPTATFPVEPTPTPQALPPGLVESHPLPNSEVGLEGPVVFYFNQSMDHASVESAFSGLSGRLEWLDDSTLVFTPDRPLTPAKQVNLQFDTQAQATNGLPLIEPISLEYHAVGFLNLAHNLPEDGTAEVDPTAAILATFNRPVVPLGADQTDLPPAFSVEPAAQGHGEWINTSTYAFYPDPALAGGTKYAVQLSNDLAGLDGSPLENSQSWSFTTIAPRLLSVEPSDGSKDVNLDSDILLTFNQPMDPSSVANEFTMFEEEKTRVRGEFSWNGAATEFVFNPDNLLKRERVYSWVLDEETSSEGGTHLGSEYQATLETISELQVIGSDPADNGEKDVYSSVAIEFNSPIKLKDALKFITITPPVVDLEAFADEDERTIWLSGFYEPDIAYTLTISPNLPDTWNGRLGQEHVLNFRTRSIDPSLTVTTGSEVVFLTPEQSSITVQVTNLPELTYSRGVVPLEDFQEVLAPGNYEARQAYRPERELTLQRELDTPPNQSTPVEIPLTLDGGPLAPGIYSLRFNVGVDYIHPGPYFLVVSDINTTLKLSATDVLVWAVNLNDGSMVGDVPVSVYAESGELLAEGFTDPEGVLHSEIPIREMEDIFGISYAILGEPGQENFSAALSNWGQGIDGGGFGYQVDYSPPHLEAYLYTDRPIYRPGQSVNFRAILRQVYNGRYDLPDRSNLFLTLINDFGEQIATLDLPLSELGTAHGLYTLPEDFEPGTYRFTIEDAHFSSVAFQVAEYRKPEIDLSITFPDEQVLAGQEIEASIEANYFFGAPAANVPVSWVLYRSQEGFYLPGYEVGKQDTRWLSGIPGFFLGGFQEQVAEGEGETNAAGNLTLGLDIPYSDERYRYTLEVTATDESGIPTSARADLLVNPEEFYIGLRPDAWTGPAGSEIGFDVQVVDWEKEPVGEQPLSAEFRKVTWERIEPEPGDLRGFPTYEAQYSPVGSTDFVTGGDGKARIAFIPPEPGTYELQVSGRGSPGENAVTQTILWVGGQGQAVWPNLPNQRLRLTADKNSYSPGETAQVFVPNPFGDGAVALVTIERGVLFEHQILPVNGSGLNIPVQLGDEQAPNVYVSVTLIKPEGEDTADFRQGYLMLPVDPVEQALNVSLTSDPVQVEPGGRIALDLLVSDAEGNPVQGEFSLSVVDLAVLALAEPNAPDILPAFYGEQPLGVNTSLSLAASTQLRPSMIEGIGGGGGGEPAPPIPVREEFLDTAYWNADVMTDAEGKAFVTVTLPDNLTSWQLDTRGVTAETKVGQDNGLVVSTKDLLVRPVTPRFLVVGDHALVAAVVHNNTPEGLEVDVSLQATGFEVDDPSLAIQNVSIPSGDRKRLEWWGTVGDVEEVDLVFAANAGELQDATRPPWGNIPVLRYIAPQTFGTSGILEDGGELLEVVSLPRSFDPGGGELNIEMAPSLGAAMLSALDVVDFYPLTNTELAVSRFLPNLETYRVIQEFGLEEGALQSRLDQLLEDSLEHLQVQQNSDGGWGWWKGNPSDSYITAYVLFGLLRAQEAGVDYESGVIASALDYLTASLPLPEMLAETWQYDRLAFTHYVLAQAGQGDVVGLSALYEERSQLNPWAQALLALAIETVAPGDERAQFILSDLAGDAVRSATGAHWENQAPSWQNMSTTTQSTAVVLYALANQDPASPLVADATRYLMAHRDASGAWTSSYETAWTLMALAAVMQGTGELSGEFDFSASLNNSPLVAGEASGISQLTPIEAEVPIQNMYPDAPNSLLMQRSDGVGRLYYNTHLNVFQPVEEIAPLDKGISINRAYFPADSECIEDACLTIDEVQAGELVTVRLTLTIPETSYYLMVEDYFPAGAEVLDVSLKTTQTAPDSPFNPQAPFEQGWGWWYFNDPRVFDDRIVWSVDWLPAGTYEFTYQFVPVLPGEYKVIPTRAYQNYFPEVQGNSAGDVFEITK
jgi:uncharacterized protein YfaS (alpha-2-macroglobulin family)